MDNAVLLDSSARAWLARLADWLLLLVVVSLPWSTSATGILMLLWLIALVPTLDMACFRRELMSAAGGLPVLLWAFGALGMLWADVSWPERLEGLGGFHKLLVIPLLLTQMRRSGRAQWMVLAFFASTVTLLAVSWFLVLAPGLTWRGKTPGVPVKDYALQSGLFAICAFGLLGQAAQLWRTRMRFALLLIALAAAFVANFLYVETARTTLVVAAVLILLFGSHQFGWKGAVGACIVGAVLASAVWVTSPNLRERVSLAVKHFQSYDASNVNTPVGLRFEYWKNSLAFIAQAPVLGHGTGSIHDLFVRHATAETHPSAIATNPHNQLLVIALQLGVLGAGVLVAMWIAHLALFLQPSLMSWFGLVVVVQNLVSCVFNSHLFDYTQGTLYVIAVGVIGGAVLQRREVGQKNAVVEEGSDRTFSRWQAERDDAGAESRPVRRHDEA